MKCSLKSSSKVGCAWIRDSAQGREDCIYTGIWYMPFMSTLIEHEKKSSFLLERDIFFIKISQKGVSSRPNSSKRDNLCTHEQRWVITSQRSDPPPALPPPVLGDL